MDTNERQQRIRALTNEAVAQRAVQETSSPDSPLAHEAGARVRKAEAIVAALEAGCDFKRYDELVSLDHYRF